MKNFEQYGPVKGIGAEGFGSMKRKKISLVESQRKHIKEDELLVWEEKKLGDSVLLSVTFNRLGFGGIYNPNSFMGISEYRCKRRLSKMIKRLIKSQTDPGVPSWPAWLLSKIKEL